MSMAASRPDGELRWGPAPPRPGLRGAPAATGADGLDDPREQALVAAAEAFTARAIAPEAGRRETEGQALPRDIIREWSDLGLNALQVSTERGGRGASYLCKIRIATAVARTCMASAFALINAQGSVTRVEREGSADQIRRYLPGLMSGEIVCAPSLSEPGAGSDFAAIATRAERVEGGWAITGTKGWVTNGAGADLLVLYAQTELGSGARGIASFLVDLHRPGVTRAAPYRLMGGGAIGAAEISFAGVFVPDDDLFAPPGTAFKRALTSITGARTHVAAMVCGIVEDSLARAVDHAGGRQAFGRPVLDHQGLRWMLTGVATELEAGRLLVNRAARLIEEGRDAVLEAAQAKSFMADMALRNVATCMQAMGAIGLAADQPFGRHLAAARIAAYVDGTTEMQRDRIGAYLATRYGGGRSAFD